MGVEPRSEAMEKYDIVVVMSTIMPSWWKSRFPLGRCDTQTSTRQHRPSPLLQVLCLVRERSEH